MYQDIIYAATAGRKKIWNTSTTRYGYEELNKELESH